MLKNCDVITTLPLVVNLILIIVYEETKIFCGHEYTVSNLEWATKVDSDNEKMKEKLRWA